MPFLPLAASILNLPGFLLKVSVERIDLPVIPSMILFISTPLGAPFVSAILISALSEVLKVGASALPSSALLVASLITSAANLSTNVGFVFLKASLSFKKAPTNLATVISFNPSTPFSSPIIGIL